MVLSRRHFLATLSGLAATLFVKPAIGQTLSEAKARKRVVIVGGGFAGTTAALALRKLAPKAEVVMIEKGPAFISAPSALEYLFDMVSWSEITRNYKALTSRGIQVLRAELLAIEPRRHVVQTTVGPLDYAFLVLATGIRLASEEIAGLKENPQVNSSLYDRSNLAELRRRIQDYRGGSVLLSIPPAPLQCPPAPYEFALLFAERIRQKKLQGKIILLDSHTNPQPPSLSRAIEQAFQRNQDIIEYVPSARVTTLDVSSKRVITEDGEKFPYDFLSLIPPHRAARFIQEAELSLQGDPFADVDPFTFRSKRFETIYALGDAARTPYSRTASSAAQSAQICAREIAKSLGRKITVPSSFQSVCFPYVSSREALSLKIDYEWQSSRVEVQPESRIDAVTDPSHGYVKERRLWGKRLLAEMFGA